MVFLGNPEYGVELQPIDFVKVAEACGGTGVRIEDPTHCADQVAEALGRPGPVLIEAVVDPLEAPMPANVTFEQARHFAESLVRGEPDRHRDRHQCDRRSRPRAGVTMAVAPRSSDGPTERKSQVLSHHRPSTVRSIVDAVVVKDGEPFFLCPPDGQIRAWPSGTDSGCTTTTRASWQATS